MEETDRMKGKDFGYFGKDLEGYMQYKLTFDACFSDEKEDAPDIFGSEGDDSEKDDEDSEDDDF